MFKDILEKVRRLAIELDAVQAKEKEIKKELSAALALMEIPKGESFDEKTNILLSWSEKESLRIPKESREDFFNACPQFYKTEAVRQDKLIKKAIRDGEIVPFVVYSKYKVTKVVHLPCNPATSQIILPKIT